MDFAEIAETGPLNASLSPSTSAAAVFFCFGGSALNHEVQQVERALDRVALAFRCQRAGPLQHGSSAVRKSEHLGRDLCARAGK